MTIKNTKKNISAEPGDLVIDVTSNNPETEQQESNVIDVDSSNNYNFAEDLIITVHFEDFLDDEKIEDETAFSTQTVSIPLSELVRKGHLEANYYDKTNSYSKSEIDAKIKLHYIVVDSVPNAATVRQQGKTNYIYLVPFSPDEESQNSSDQYQEGHFIEYIYVIDDNGNNERMERIGSTKLDLKPFLKIANLDTELNNLATSNQSSTYKTLVNQVATNTSAIPTKVAIAQNMANAFMVTNGSKNVTTSAKIGNIDIGGYLYSGNNKVANKILITNSNGLITHTDNLLTTNIKSAEAISGKKLTATTDTTQHQINQSIDDILYNIYNVEFPKYLKLDNIKSEIWGNSGFSTLQNNEQNNTYKNYKLGEYIYYKLYDSGDFYKKSEVQNNYSLKTHEHGNINKNGEIGSTSGLPLITTTNGKIATGVFGSNAGQFAEGNHQHSQYLTDDDIHGFVNENRLNQIQDAYIVSLDVPELCNYTSLSNEAEENKTLENLLHAYDNNIENAILLYTNSEHKNNSCIIVLDKVGVFYYTPDRNSSENPSGTVEVMQLDLTTAIPVTTEDLDNTSGFLTVVDLADYLKDVDVIDSLDSDAINKPLSAKQGKELVNAIPTRVGQLTNDKGYLTSSDLGGYTTSSDLPTKVSDLENDTGFITSSDLPTKVSDLENDSEFINKNVNNLTNYTTTTNMNSAIANAIGNLDIVTVLGANENLPISNIVDNKLYLKPNTTNGTDNKYDIYVYVEGAWEKIDSLDFNIGDYLKASDAANTYATPNDVDTKISTHNSNTTNAHGIDNKISKINGSTDILLASGDHVLNTTYVYKNQGNTDAVKNKSLATNAQGIVGLEDKNNHGHGEIDKDGKITTLTDTVGNVVVTDESNIIKVKNKIPFANLDGVLSKSNDDTTTGTLTAKKFIKSNPSNANNILLANGDDIPKTTFASNGHTHDERYIKIGSITSSDITNETIKNEDIAQSAGISTGKLTHYVTNNCNFSNIAPASISAGSELSQAYINEGINAKLGTKIDTAGTGFNKSGTTLQANNFSLAFAPQDIYGLIVSTYTDGLNVYVAIIGSLNGDSDLPTQGNNKTIGALTDSNYAPHSTVYSSVHPGNNSKIRIFNSGAISFINQGSTTTFPVDCSLYYPLKSRFPF